MLLDAEKECVTTMKKILALLLAVMMLPCIALADAATVLASDPEEMMTFDRESDVTAWEGNWTLVAAYIGEDYAEENGLETTGLIPLTVENAATLTIETVLDGSANDKQLGTMVDVASYIHAHVYDMSGTLTFVDAVATGDEAVYTVKTAWDEWPNNVVRGENDGDFNIGPAKTHIKGEDETLYWATLTGVEVEDMDEMKYIGLNTNGQLILCYADDNVAKKEGDVCFAYIFERAE